jgi:4-amino-4-deoxy-L-arabinose transferase-like glycosyltransferase
VNAAERRLPDRFWIGLILLAVGGVALRLLYVYVIAPDVRGFGDWYLFHEQANLIAQGHGFIDPSTFYATGRESATAGHPPLWPLVLSSVSKLGFTGAHAHRAMGAGLAGVTIVLLGLLGRRVASQRAGLLAAALYSVHPLMIGADASLMSECLYGLLIALMLLLAYRLHDEPGPVPAAALGAAIGLASLVRAEAILYVPLLALPLALRMPIDRGRALAAAVTAFVVVLAPWTIRNAIVFDRPVIVSNNGSQTLAGANCPQTYHGPDTGLWQIACISPQRAGENEAEGAARWTREGVGYMADHPGDLPRVMTIRALRTWDLYQPWRMVGQAEGRDPDIERAGIVVYWLLLLPAAAGVFVLHRRRRNVLILLAPVALAVAVSIAFYGIPRFRHGADVAIIVLAAIALDAALQRAPWRQARPRPAD